MEAPNRGLHENDLKRLQKEITSKKKECQKVFGTRDNPGEVPSMRSRLAELGKLIKVKIGESRALNGNLQAQKDSMHSLNSQVSELMASGDIYFKDEEKLQNAIKAKDGELRSVNFPIREEQKLVFHMNRLKRNLKRLPELHALEKERKLVSVALEEVRSRKMEAEKQVKQMRNEFTYIKRKLTATENLGRELKEGIRRAYAEKSKMINQYNQELETYKKASWSKKMRSLAEEEEENTLEPFYTEKLSCRSLIAYLEKHHVDEGRESSPDRKQAVIVTDAEGDLLTPNVSEYLEFPPLSKECSSNDSTESIIVENLQHLALRKKDSDSGEQFQTKQRKKSAKKDKRRGPQPMTHSAQIYYQIASLDPDLLPPATYSEVPAMIETLKERLAYYEESTAIPDFDGPDGWQYMDTGSDVADSAIFMTPSASQTSFSSMNDSNSALNEFKTPSSARSRRSTPGPGGLTSPSEYDRELWAKAHGGAKVLPGNAFIRSQSESDIKHHVLSELSSSICAQIEEHEIFLDSQTEAVSCGGDEGIDAGKTASKDSSINSEHAPLIIPAVSIPVNTTGTGHCPATEQHSFDSLNAQDDDQASEGTLKRRNYASACKRHEDN